MAVAGKPLGFLSGKAVMPMTRVEVEMKMTLLGFLLFSNQLKGDAESSIASMNLASCRCIMATGDSPLTAIAVSKDCGLIKEDE